jgi:hypothetical protein
MNDELEDPRLRRFFELNPHIETLHRRLMDSDRRLAFDLLDRTFYQNGMSWAPLPAPRPEPDVVEEARRAYAENPTRLTAARLIRTRLRQAVHHPEIP